MNKNIIELVKDIKQIDELPLKEMLFPFFENTKKLCMVKEAIKDLGDIEDRCYSSDLVRFVRRINHIID